MEKEETQNLSLLQFLVMKGDGLLAFVRTFAKSWEILILSEDHLTSNFSYELVGTMNMSQMKLGSFAISLGPDPLTLAYE